MKNSIVALILFLSSASCFATLDANTAQSMDRAGVVALSLNRWGGPSKTKTTSLLHLELVGGFGCTLTSLKNFDNGTRTGRIEDVEVPQLQSSLQFQWDHLDE